MLPDTMFVRFVNGGDTHVHGLLVGHFFVRTACNGEQVRTKDSGGAVALLDWLVAYVPRKFNTIVVSVSTFDTAMLVADELSRWMTPSDYQALEDAAVQDLSPHLVGWLKYVMGMEVRYMQSNVPIEHRTRTVDYRKWLDLEQRGIPQLGVAPKCEGCQAWLPLCECEGT